MATDPLPQPQPLLQLMRCCHGNHPPFWIIIRPLFWILISHHHFEFFWFCFQESTGTLGVPVSSLRRTRPGQTRSGRLGAALWAAPRGVPHRASLWACRGGLAQSSLLCGVESRAVYQPGVSPRGCSLSCWPLGVSPRAVYPGGNGSRAVFQPGVSPRGCSLSCWPLGVSPRAVYPGGSGSRAVFQPGVSPRGCSLNCWPLGVSLRALCPGGSGSRAVFQPGVSPRGCSLSCWPLGVSLRALCPEESWLRAVFLPRSRGPDRPSLWWAWPRRAPLLQSSPGERSFGRPFGLPPKASGRTT